MSARASRAKSPSVVHTPVERDVNYTIPALIAIVAVVLLTALFFAKPTGTTNTMNAAGQAAGIEETLPAVQDTCEATSHCEGSKLVRQASDCNTYVAYCQYGCSEIGGHAICN